jgi:hypothetical protein
MTSPLAAGSLLLDIAGGLTLASAFIFKRPSSLRAESRSYVGYNPSLFLSLAKQTADAWVGGFLLSVGFLGQLLSSAGVEPSWLCLSAALGAAFTIDVLAFLVLWRVLRPFSVRRSLELQLAETWREYLEAYPSREEGVDAWWNGLKTWAEAAGVQRRPDEPLPELGRRLLGKRRWRRLAAEKDAPPPDRPR